MQCGMRLGALSYRDGDEEALKRCVLFAQGAGILFTRDLHVKVERRKFGSTLEARGVRSAMS